MRVIHQIILLTVLTCLVYASSLFNQFIWDDEQFIYKNQYVLTFDLPKILTTNTIAGAGQMSDYYRPLATISFAIDHLIWGLRPFGFHLTNSGLHIAAGIFLFLLLREIKLKKPALIISLIFLLHPLQTEAVSYINSRGDSLYAFWGMLSLLFLSKALHNQNITFKYKDISLQLTKVMLLVLSTLFYILAILSKEIGTMILGLQFLIFVVTAINENHSWSSIKQKIFDKNIIIYFFTTSGVAAGYFLLRATVLNFQNSFNLYQSVNIYATSITVRLLTFSKIIWIYLRLMIFPFPLHMERNTSLVTTIFSIWTIATLLLGIFIIVFSIWEIKKHRTAWMLLGSGWMLISLSPVSGIVPINGLLYEHWLYLPLIGFVIFIYGWLNFWPHFFKNIFKYQNQLFYFFIGLFTIYGLLTIRQNWLWRSPISFYTYLLKYAQSARIHNNLAMAYSDKNKYDQAIYHYQQAIKLDDHYPQTHHNLGILYLSMNNLTAAEQEFSLAISMNPEFYFSYPYLINIYAQQQKYQSAQNLLTTLLTAYPQEQQLVKIQKQLQQQMSASGQPTNK